MRILSTKSKIKSHQSDSDHLQTSMLKKQMYLSEWPHNILNNTRHRRKKEVIGLSEMGKIKALLPDSLTKSTRDTGLEEIWNVFHVGRWC